MKPKAINPKETTRLEAFELWMSAPNPMVTFFKQINVTNLVRISKKYKLKFNMLLCWCIGKAASEVKEFYIFPVQGKFLELLQKNIDNIGKKQRKVEQ